MKKERKGKENRFYMRKQPLLLQRGTRNACFCRWEQTSQFLSSRPPRALASLSAASSPVVTQQGSVWCALPIRRELQDRDVLDCLKEHRERKLPACGSHARGWGRMRRAVCRRWRREARSASARSATSRTALPRRP
jgi:hypothetical protein